MPLKLYNTMGRRLEEFVPIVPGQAGFYSCGPTVYNYPHIGNLRAFVFDDTLSRALSFLGYRVTHVMNVTDVGHLSDDADSGEDKMMKSAAERGKTVWEIADFYAKAFLADLDAINAKRPSVICKATDHITEMILLIRRIEAAGFTYSAGGNLYFDVTRFPRYGELALLKLEDLKAGARVAADPNKRNPADFVLWFTKSKFDGQAMVWDSPWGRGYPGWHIECSAMSMRYLGETFDIHAGGVDHIPVHHTNEIAQSEAATGKKWVNYWVHNEFLLMGDTKMSKSLGNFITLSGLAEEGFHALDYRYFLLGGHYRSQLSFSLPALEAARSARRAAAQRIARLKEASGGRSAPPSPGGAAEASLLAFRERIEEDLNTPRALAELWALLKDGSVPAAEALGALSSMDEALGLSLLEAPEAEAEMDAALKAEVETLVKERAEAKKARDFARADAIRDGLKARGIVLEDGPGGTTFRPADGR
jgi:cysteinyl-tRNA synthetase